MLRALVLFLAWGGGLGAALPGGQAPQNQFCPVLTEEKVDPEISIVHEGRTIGFCCERCVKKFRAAPAAYLGNLPGLSPLDGLPRKAEAQGLARLARLLGKLHPAAVHFPIALLLAAAVAEILHVRTRKGVFRQGARFAAAAGAITAALAAPLGWAAASHTPFPPSLGETLEWHERLGIGTAVASAVCALLSESSARRPGKRLRGAYLTSLFVAAGLAAAAGYFGGTLVFGSDHFRW